MNNVEREIRTAADAIAESVKRSEIIHVCLDMLEADKLGLAAESCEEQFCEPRMTEYRGTTEDGQTWCVRDLAE
jgi:SH3-like domain-containing protein